MRVKDKETIMDGALRNIRRSMETVWLNGYRHGIFDNPDERMHGKWIKEDPPIHKGAWCCSLCREHIPVMALDMIGKPMYKYCPNCGAALEVEE